MNTIDYNKCVDQLSDDVFRFIVKNIRDEEKARDIVQDAFERLWINASKIDFSKAKSYLFTTAYRVMIDDIRKSKHDLNYRDQIDVAPRTHQPTTDLNAILEDALDQLPEQQKSMILLRDYEGYSYKEIGEILNINEGQVKVYIYRARKALKSYLGSIENVI